MFIFTDQFSGLGKETGPFYVIFGNLFIL